MKTVHYFYRHPYQLYFSIEKLFNGISAQINSSNAGFEIKTFTLPFMVGFGNIWKNIRFVKQHQGQINHITGDAHYAILGCDKNAFNVLTVHDCVLLTQISKTNLRYWFIKWVWYSLPVKKANVITVISENTKRDLINYTGCHPDKIVVIENYLDSKFSFSPHIFNEQRPTILFIGTAANKNLNRLIEALNGMPVFLQIVGHISEEQRALLSRNGLGYAIDAQLSIDALIGKYQTCDLLAFPSIYEGFGLPIIEAQATGRVVLTSNLSPMKEVAGNGACLIDPLSIESIRNGMERIIGDKSFRDNLVELGKENAQRFELKQVAENYLAIYRHAT